MKRTLHNTLIVAVLVGASAAGVRAADEWQLTGSLNIGRMNHTATLLQDGTVLVSGGYNGNDLSSCELYDPQTGSWVPVGSLQTARRHHSAVLLRDGRVLVVGGGQTPSGSVPASELYDPATRSWGPAGSLSVGRLYLSATLLADGRVLVAGGRYWNGGGYTFVSTAEIYDPATGLWSTTDSLNAARSGHQAVLLHDGRVLVADGQWGSAFLSSSEVFDPDTEEWSPVASSSTSGIASTMTVIGDGQVLVAGGAFYENGWHTASSIELYDPATDTWETRDFLDTSRASHAAVLLPNNQVLVVGGWNASTGNLASCEQYAPLTGEWTACPPLNAPRGDHEAVLLETGDVLVAGGYLFISPPQLYPSECELYVAGNVDADGDGIDDEVDICVDTTIPEAVPTKRLGVNRWALVDDDGAFDTTPPPGGGGGPEFEFTVEDTRGCSCEQIIDAMDLGWGHTKFGCSTGVMLQWTSSTGGGGGNDPTQIATELGQTTANSTTSTPHRRRAPGARRQHSLPPAERAKTGTR